MKKSVLVIDDDADDLLFFRDALSEINPFHECFTSSDAQDALLKLKQNLIEPHFIFLDVNMPGMRGPECLGEIKKIPHLTKIPVIVWSTSVSLRDVETVNNLGASLYLRKPNRFDDLVSTIKKIIEV